MSTIQKQLEAIGPSFVVDGVRWEVERTIPTTILIAYISNTKITLWSTDGLWWTVEIANLGCSESIHIQGETTPADACRQALAICRERVAELAKALGMAVYNDEPSGAGLRNHLLKHADREKVEDACRHRLGVGLQPTSTKKPNYVIGNNGLDIYTARGFDPVCTAEKKELAILIEKALNNQPTGEDKQTVCAKPCHICGGINGHTTECTSWCGDTVVV